MTMSYPIKILKESLKKIQKEIDNRNIWLNDKKMKNIFGHILSPNHKEWRKMERESLRRQRTEIKIAIKKLSQ